MSEQEALQRLDSMQADLGLTVHQTAEALRVVRSLRWQVQQWVPEHSAASPSEECAGSYPPTQLSSGKDTPDECWFDGRLPSMRPELWQQRRKRSRAEAV